MLMQNQRPNPLNQVLESFKNINNALNIAQSKGVFTLEQSSIIYKALQDVNEYFEKAQQHKHMKSSQTITRMTKEEAEDSAAQEEKGIVLNEAEQKKLRRINEIENQIAQAVETSSESSIEENQEEYENVDEVVEEDEVEDVVEEEVEDEVEEEVEDVVEEEVEDVVKEVEPNTLPSNYFTKQYQKQRRERLNEENRISNIFYSDSDDDETIEI